jgi:hypothetical protein
LKRSGQSRPEIEASGGEHKRRRRGGVVQITKQFLLLLLRESLGASDKNDPTRRKKRQGPCASQDRPALWLTRSELVKIQLPRTLWKQGIEQVREGFLSTIVILPVQAVGGRNLPFLYPLLQ